MLINILKLLSTYVLSMYAYSSVDQSLFLRVNECKHC